MCSEDGKKVVTGLERISSEQHLRTLSFSSSDKRDLKGDLIASYSFLRRGCGKGSTELTSLISTDGTHGNGSKLHQGTFILDVKKHFLTEKMLKQASS